MFILKFLPDKTLMRVALGVLYVYNFLRITYVFTHTDRYIDQRPGDALMMTNLIDILVVVGLPIFIIVWCFGFIPITALWFAIMAAILFFSPLILVTAMCEYTVFKYRHHVPPQSS